MRPQSEILAQAYEACCDCESTLRTAAQVVESARLREHFARGATRWHEFAAALHQIGTSSGLSLDAAPGIAAALHRARINLNAAVRDEQAIEAECAQREAVARARVGAMLSGELPAELRFKLEDVHGRMLRMHSRPGGEGSRHA